MRGVEQVLFDRPGPRGRRRIAVATVVAVLLLAGLVALAVHQFGAHGQLAGDRWQPFTDWLNIRFLLIGLRYTALVTAVSAVISLPAGALVALGRLSTRWYLHYPAVVYTELFRSLPTLLLMYVFLLAFPAIHVNLLVVRITGIDVPTFWNLVIAICLTGTATIAEVFRAGILALSAGQTEAARAIGMRYWQTMRLIVLPQVVRALLPLLLVQLINLLKDSTLGYAVGYTELLYSGKILAEYVHAPIQTYLVVTVLYMIVNWLITRLAHYVERRQGRLPRFRAGRPVVTRAAAE
jgi:glutamate transport system permease protein